MAGQTDADLIIGANISQAQSAVTDFARRVESKPIRLRIDGGQALGTISGKIGEFEKSLAAASSRVIAFGASAGQVYLMSRALDALVKSTIDVQKELADINNILGLSSKQLEGFSGSLFKVANETGQSFKSAANSALEFSRQGLSVAETLKRTKDALTLTRLSGLDVVESTKAITAALNSFNDVALDSTVLINKLSSVDASYAVSSGDLAQALQRVGSTAQDTGVSFDSLIGLVTSAQQITSRGGAVIGNSLKSIFQRIQRPEVLDNLKQLGILTEDINGKTLSADKILQNTARAYKDLSSAQKEQIVQLSSGVFQANQFRAILADLGKSSSIYERALNTSTNATDQAARRQAELNKTLASQFNEAVNNAQQFASKVGNISLAPALNNIFKGINLVSNTGLGDALGEGVLKGLGNYLSGPGLALGTILISKLFGSFATQAAKSFAQILEVQSTRVQTERVITELLLSEVGAVNKINAAGNDTVKVQQIINELLAKQNLTLNENAAAAARVAAITSTFSLPGGAGLTKSAFSISNDKLVPNPRAKLPGFSALSDAISRERKMGIDPSQIRVGSSAQLISADNPLGIGIYNTKDEPLGIQQGINRAVKGGSDPKKAGTEIPNFVDFTQGNNPFPFLPKRFLPPDPTFDVRSLVPDSVKLGDVVKNTKEFNDELYRLSRNLRDTIDNQNSLKLLRSPAIALPQFTESSKNEFLAGSSTGQTFGPNTAQFYAQQRFNGGLNPLRPLAGIGGLAALSIGPSVLSGNDLYKRILNDKIKDLESRLANVNVLNAAFKLPGLEKEASNLGLQGTFRNRLTNLKGQALGASFLTPIIGGIAQQGVQSAFGDNPNSTQRGITASVGGLANVTSFGLTGLGVGGPVGAAVGTALGLAIELPSIINAFTDTLPDLKKRLEDLTEESQRTSASFTGYLSSLQQLESVNSGASSATKGQFNNIQAQNQRAFLSLPSKAREEITKAQKSGDFSLSTASDIADRFTSAATQAQNFQIDLIDLEKRLKEGGGDLVSGNSRGNFGIPIVNAQSTVGKPLNLISGGEFNPKDFKDLFSSSTSGLSGSALEISRLFDSLLGQTSPKTGESLLKSLTPEDISQLQKSLASGSGTFNTTLGNTLANKGFLPNQIQGLVESLGDLAEKFPSSFKSGASKSISQSNVDSIKGDQEELKKSQKDFTNTLETINSDIIKLTESTSKSVNDFNIKVLQELSKNISNIDVASINRQGKNQITLLNSGDNSYLKNYISFQEKLAQDKDDYDKSQAQFNSELQSSSTGALTSGKNSLLESLKSKIENDKLTRDSASANTSFAKSSSLVSSVFGNINSDTAGGISSQIAKEISETSLLKQQQPLINTVRSELSSKPGITTGTLDKIKSLPEGNLKNTLLSGKINDVSNLSVDDKTLELLNNELLSIKKTVNDSLLKYSKDLATIQSNLESNDRSAGASFSNAASFLNEQAKRTRNSVINSGIIGRNNISAQGSLQRQQIGSSPFQNSTLQANSQFQDVLTGVRQDLSRQLPASFNVNNIDKGGIDSLISTTGNNIENLKNFNGPLSKGQSDDLANQQGILENLVNAADRLDQANKNRTQSIEEQNRLLQLQLSFTDRVSAAVLEVNTGKAAQGTLTGTDFRNAALAPLAYNTQTFNRDAIVGLQDFSRTIKDDLTTSIHQVTAGAKSASEAFRDLGLSLAQSLADKASTIGINALFGLGVNALGVSSSSFLTRPPASSSSPTPTNSYALRSSGGYIAKFAKGGFVNMGSGNKDDVPAFLSGGEFVINRKAVSKIGKNNLDALNGGAFQQSSQFIGRDKAGKFTNFAGVQSDSISGDSNTANITLVNAFNLTAKGKSAGFNTSPLLSLIGQSDERNPQNNIKFSRERYAFARVQAYKQYQDQLAAYNVQQYISLGQAYLGAIGAVAGAVVAGSGGSSGGVKGGYDTPAPAAGNYDSFSNPGGYITAAKGSYIPRFADGGYFGGDSSSDKFRAMVMGGEYVVSPQTVNKYGTNYFKGLNDAGKYADGGSVGASSYGSSNDSNSQITNILSQIRDRLGGQSSSNPVGSQSNNQTIHVTNNITMKQDGTVSSSDSSSREDRNGQTSQKDRDGLRKFGDQIKSQTIKVITDESKPGGLLHLTFAKRNK